MRSNLIVHSFGLNPAVQLLPMQWAVGVVWRLGLCPQWKSHSVAETAFVQSLQAGHNFGDTCEVLALCVGQEQAAPVAAQVLREFLDSGVIDQVVLPQTSAVPAV